MGEREKGKDRGREGASGVSIERGIREERWVKVGR
jgi:hypothetical protein